MRHNRCCWSRLGARATAPESLAAVALVEQQVELARHLIVTCNPEGKLGKLQLRQAMTLQLPEATHDASFAMTSSFSCMLSATLPRSAPHRYRMPCLPALAEATTGTLTSARAPLQALAALACDRVVYLGSGVLQGLAREAALKLGRLSNGAVAACYDTPLGFRHGPKTFITANTLVFVFVSNAAIPANTIWI